MRKIILPVLGFFIFGSTVISAATTFSDVPASSWYYADVMKMVEWGVIRGNDDGTFRPNNSVNRAELSAMWNRYDQKVYKEQALENDALRFSLIQSVEQNALLYQNLASLYYIATDYNPSCEMIEYYYERMADNYRVAKFLSGEMVNFDFRVDSAKYDATLAVFKDVNDQCSFD